MFISRRCLLQFSLLLLHFFLDLFRLEAFDLQVNPDIRENRHVLIRYPDQREEGEQVASPVGQQEFVSGEYEEECSDVVAEAIFAGEEVEELPFQQRG